MKTLTRASGLFYCYFLVARGKCAYTTQRPHSGSANGQQKQPAGSCPCHSHDPQRTLVVGNVVCMDDQHSCFWLLGVETALQLVCSHHTKKADRTEYHSNDPRIAHGARQQISQKGLHRHDPSHILGSLRDNSLRWRHRRQLLLHCPFN